MAINYSIDKVKFRPKNITSSCRGEGAHCLALTKVHGTAPNCHHEVPARTTCFSILGRVSKKTLIIGELVMLVR